MLYYRVKKEFDNVRRVRYAGRWRKAEYDVFVGGELFTPMEWKKICDHGRVIFRNRKKRVPIAEVVEAVEVSQRKIYWFFGARFEAK